MSVIAGWSIYEGLLTNILQTQKMEKKRNRKPNWTEEQCLLLAQLVNEHKGDDCEKRWYVLQSKAKDEIAAHKRESSLTGGGPPAKRLSQVADTVFQVLGHSEVSVTGLPTGIDTSMMQALEMQQSIEPSQEPGPSMLCTAALHARSSQAGSKDQDERPCSSIVDPRGGSSSFSLLILSGGAAAVVLGPI
ncbi:unnamed protein product [Gadus morhua 'NCC']